jgi:autotransporter-associated beta strand protein
MSNPRTSRSAIVLIPLLLFVAVLAWKGGPRGTSSTPKAESGGGVEVRRGNGNSPVAEAPAAQGKASGFDGNMTDASSSPAGEGQAKPDMARIEAFQEWTARWKEADSKGREALIKEGLELATARRGEFKALIATDPRRALELAVPRVIRQDLPAGILAQLESPVSAKGDFNVYMGRPAPGVEVPPEGLTLRYFESEGVSYKARVFGELEHVTSRQGFPLQGVSIDREFAVAENAVRRLEIGERITAGTTVESSCPVSGKTTTAVASGEPVTDDSPTVEIAGRVITLCNGSHVTVLEDNFRTYVQANGSGGAGFFMENFPGTASTAIGNLRCLYIRVTYPDQMAQPNTEEQAYADMRDNARFFLENSYGKMTQTTTFTPLITLPRSLAWYKAKDGEVDCLGLVHSDARTVARELGYDSGQFNCIIVRVNKGPRLEGISWGGGSSVWITWDGMDVLNHEIGHSLGRNHANSWTSLDGTPYGYGQNAEYGNPFDVMGGSGGFSAHYNTISKRALNWLPTAYVHSPKANGVYRIFAYDQPTLEEGKRYALTVAKDSVRQYNLEYHPARGGYLSDNALVLYSGMGSNAGHLLDTTQGSPNGKNDGGIAIGRTYSDLEADMHFTVLAKNNTTPPSLDIAYQRGPFPGNVAPTTTIAASTTNALIGDTVTFTATASDSNGDALAYQWEFSDGVAGTNSASISRTFAAAAQVTAMVTVSDMKGGSVRASVVVNVGSHGKQLVTGTITAGGQPLAGVYLTGGGSWCYSNADGTYSLPGITAGAQTLSATLNGYTLTPSFTNPLTVVAGSNVANWTAAASNFVTLSKVSDATEGGANGVFRLTRSGDASAALTVLVSPVSGTAIKTTDYTFTPDSVASGSFQAFTIPAGAASLDVSVAAVNDTAAEGTETIGLQLASAAGYLSGTVNAVVMSLIDNDTSLPQVAVIAPDPYANESSGDSGSFTFTRTGSTAAALNLTVTWTGGATNGTDYASLPTTVTIPIGQSSVTLDVNPMDDSEIEAPEDVIATLSSNAAYLLTTGASSATVTISDNDTPYVSVTIPDASSAEAGPDSGVFLVSRTGSTASSLKVYYGLSGSAQHGTDYTALSGEVTIPAGAVSAPVVILPIDDDLGEQSETVTLAVTTFNNAYSLGTSFQGDITIADNTDAPLLNVRSGTVGVEGGANATFVIRSVGSGSGSVTVNYTLSGTATSGADYTALSGSVSVPVNGSNDTTVTIPVINDAVGEPTETVVVTLSSSASYRVYNDGIAELVILDNDSGDRVMVSTYNHSPSEAGPVAGTFYLSRTGTVGALDVSYTLSGTATNGVDYATLSGVVTIPDTQAGVNLVMTPLDDAVFEGSETVTLTVTAAAGYQVDRPASATYVIADNEASALTVGFQQTALASGELPGGLGEYRDIAVQLSAPSASPVTVAYRAGGGDAIGDDVDWTYVDAVNGNAVIPSGTLIFAPGETSKNLRVKVKNDGFREGTEVAVLQLANANGAGLTPGRSTFNLFIFDDTVPTLVTEERWNNGAVYTNNTWSTVSPDYTGYLTGFTPAQNVADNYSRRLTGLITAPTSGSYTFWIASDDASRLYLSTDATAANKTQIATLTSWTSFQNWTANASQQSVAINLVAGQSYYMEVQHQEGGGGDHVSVAWQGPGFARTPIALALPDNYPRSVRFVVSSTTRGETDGSEPLLMALLDRPAGTTAVTVDYGLGGTATAGSDYLLSPGTLTFAAGEQVKLLPLSILADSIGEAPETIVVTLANPSGCVLASPSTHTISLIDSNAFAADTKYFTATSVMASGTLLGTATATPASGRSLASWQILSGNTGNAFAINSSGQVTLQTPAALPNPGVVQLTVRATDNLGSTGDGSIHVLCNSAQSLAWINPAGGSWPVQSNWFGGTVAGGVGVVPNFGVLDLTADATVTLNGATTIGGAIFGDLSPSHNWTIATGTAGPLTLDVASGAPLVAVNNQTATIAAVLAGADGLTKNGNGTLRITGAGTWTGTTTVSAGTLEVFAKSGDVAYSVAQGATLRLAYNTGGGYSPGITLNGNGITSSAGLYLGGGRTIQTNGGLLIQTQPTTIRTDGSGTANLQGFDVNSAYFLRTVAAASGSIVESDINFQTGSYGYKIQTDSGSATGTGDLVIKGLIVGGGSAQVGGEALATSLHKWGTGSLKLTGTSTYNKATSINQGSIIVSGGNDRIPTVSTVVLGNGTNSGRLVLDGVSQAVAGVQVNGTATTNAVVGGSSTPSTFEVANATAVTFGGRIGGTGTNENNLSLRKSGAGLLTLSSANTYTGETRINAGTLALSSAGSLASSPITVGSGALLDVSSVSGGYSLGSGKVLSVSGTVLGPVTTAAGSTLSVGGSVASATITGNLTLAGTTSLRVSKSGTALSNDVIGGVGILTQGGSLVVSASGDPLVAGDSFTLFGANTFAGGFSATSLPSLLPGFTWNVSQLATSGTISVQSVSWSAIEDSAFSGTLVSAYSAPGLTYARIAGPSWLSIAANGALSGTPSNNDVGSNSFTVRVTQPGVGFNDVVILISVSNVNDAPVFSSNPILAAATEDLAFSGQLLASDADAGDSLTFAKVSGPAWLGVSPAGVISGTPSNAEVGSNAFVVRVTDASNASVTADLNITVANVNDAPVFTLNPINLNATEDVGISGQLQASDVDAGDTLTFVKVSGPSWLNVSASGALSGTPGNSEVGLNSFTVSVTDSSNVSVTAALNLTVANVNDAPTFASNPVNLSATEDVAFSGQLSASDVDAGDTLTFAKVSGPSWLNVSASGALSGTPTNAEVGLNAFTVSVTDSSNASVTASLNLTVANVNDAPAFASNPISLSATEDAAFSGQLSASDVDTGDTLSFAKVSGPAWLNVSASGALSGTPTNSEVGPNAFTVSVTDSANASVTATLNLTVSNVNDAPTFASDPILANATENLAFTGQLAASDVDAGDSLTFTKVSGPSWLSVSSAGALSGTPGFGTAGLNSFVVQVTDASNASVTAGLDITVASADLSADSDGDGFTNGLELALGTDANSSSSQPDSSYSGLRAWWRLNEASGTIADDTTGQSQDGTVAGGAAWVAGLIGNALSLDGVDDGAFVGNSAALTGTTDFTLSAWVKMNPGSPAATIIQQREPGGLGYLGEYMLNVNAGGTVNFFVYNSGYQFNLNTTASVTDGQWHLVSATRSGSAGTIYIDGVQAASGSGTVQPLVSLAVSIGYDYRDNNKRFSGLLDDVRIYSRALSATELNTIHDNLIPNGAPAFVSDPFSKPAATEDASYSGSLAGSAIDPDFGDALLYSKVSGPAWLTIAADGTLGGVPANTNVGANNFVVRVTDPSGLTDDAALSITVTNTNDAPVFAADPINASATEDSAFSGQLSASDVDAGDTLTFAKVSGPAWLSVSASGALSGTPSNSEVGANAFSVSVTDSSNATVTAALNITVANVNDAPTFTANPINLAATEDSAFSGQLSASDVDAGDTLTFAKVSGPAWLSVSASGALSGTPTNAQVGLNVFVVSASDASNATVTATLNVTVANVNDAPVFTTNPINKPNGNETVAYTGQTIAGSTTDPDAGDTVTFSKVSGPAWLVVASNGALSGTPPAGSAGVNAFVVRATDGAGATVDATLNITIIAAGLPAPWVNAKLGTANLTGSVSHNAGTFTLSGSGIMSGTADTAQFVYQTLSGDGEIIARIPTVGATGANARVGVMIRDTLATGSRHVTMSVNGSSAYRLVVRSTTGGTTTTTNSSTGTAPNLWVRLVRTGNTITSYRSTNGTAWTLVATSTVTMATNCYIGLVDCSGSNTTLNTSSFSTLSVTP